MNILVCGGAGYIGAHMCQQLAASGHRVFVFDNLSTGHIEAVRWGELIRGDLLIKDDINRAFKERAYSAVMHFSAKSLVGESMQYPELYYQNNVAGTLNLLEAMVRHDVKALIFSSSASVYGTPEYSPIDEQHPKAPINPYGRSKLMVETMLSDFDAAYGLRSVSLRYFNAAGAEPGAGIGEDHDPETHLIPNVLKSVLQPSAHPLKIFGNDYDTPDGTCIRDYIHVTDLCGAHLKALDYLLKGGSSQIFNLGNGKGFTVLDVVRSAEAVTGCKISYTMAERRLGDPAILVASAEKASRVLGWKPNYTDLSAIIATAWKWHRAQAQDQ
jgi:UDP-glucose 4-epimerase